MSAVYKYKVFCTTDNKWEYVWKHEAEGAPTVCPFNASHTINTLSVAVVDAVSSEDITISSKVGGGGPQLNPRGTKFTATKNTTTTHDFAISEPLRLKGGRLECEGNVLFDTVDVSIVDIDNVWGYGAGFSVPYVVGWPVSKTGIDVIENDRYTETPLTGVYLRVTYYSTGLVNDVKVTLGVRAYK